MYQAQSEDFILKSMSDGGQMDRHYLIRGPHCDDEMIGVIVVIVVGVIIVVAGGCVIILDRLLEVVLLL